MGVTLDQAAVVHHWVLYRGLDGVLRVAGRRHCVEVVQDVSGPRFSFLIR